MNGNTLSKIKLKLNAEGLSYKKASDFQGVLFTQIDPEYADYLHKEQLHPYSQYIYNNDGVWNWCISTLSSDAYAHIIEPILKPDFQHFKIINGNIDVDIKDTPIGRLVRKIVGMDRADVNEAFSKFLSDEKLNVNQIRFVNLIVDYIVANGNIEDDRILMNEPFKSVGSMPVLFKDNMSTARDILSIVEIIKSNSEQIAL
ncbi:type I restriction-modification enzyme R subunit C-terminal domain-containing protein [Oribacterium sp. NK2B42]|uniref:type I restriction-modification enzyme R subunit C-terminal domain-containing protein n=1 Tax=Oribacterium sp. NK2B42 TaxID=689781 RepID=UPI000404CFAD|nr:type I restriction-modification enzyme R subunit C-terminal domain-containing protein [Oribacterium sp. NK2B42]